MELSKDIIGKYINIADNEVPMVSYKHDVTDQVLKKFFCIKRKTDVVLGKVLAQFGYKEKDSIYLTDILYKDNRIVIYYEVNGKKDNTNKITIEFSNLIYDYNMIISDKDRDVTCKITVFNRKNIDFKVSKIVDKLDNGNTYLREYNSYSAKYKVIVNDREVELYLGIKMYDEFYERNMLLLERESELENYLKNVDLSLGLENIYKDIDSYIGDGIKHVNISLSIKLLNNRLEPVVTDKISVKNGECVEFMVTRGNRCISIDKDGNCVSKYNDEYASVVTTVNDDNATYTISAPNEIALREQAFIHGVQGYENAMYEIMDTKKRILELVPKKK